MKHKGNIREYMLYAKLKKRVYEIIASNGGSLKKSGEGGLDFDTSLDFSKLLEIRLFRVYNRLLKTLSQIETIIILLGEEPSTFVSQHTSIKYSDYLTYNLENYFLRMTTFFDQAVILVSGFYKLGQPPKDTSLRYLAANYHTKDTQAVKLLKDFEKLLRKTREVRNRIAHRGEFEDVDLLVIEAHLDLLPLLGDEIPTNPNIDEMAHLVDELIETKVSIVRNGLKSAKKFLFALDHVLSNDEAYF